MIRKHTQTHTPLEALRLIGEEVLYVSTASEYSLQVDPTPLDVNPHVKHAVDLVQTLLPRQSIVLKHL